MGVHLYTNGAWTDSGKIYRNSANLFNYQTMAGTIKGFYLDDSGNLQESTTAAVSDYIPCVGGSFALDKLGGVSPSVCLYDNNKQFLYGQAYNTGSGTVKQIIIIDTSYTASFIRFSYFYTGTNIEDDLSTIMLNAGIIALPYEPYNVVDWYTNSGHGYSSGAWN